MSEKKGISSSSVSASAVSPSVESEGSVNLSSILVKTVSSLGGDGGGQGSPNPCE